MSTLNRQLFEQSRSLRIRDVVLDASDDPQTHRNTLARIVLDEMFQFVGLLDVQGRTLEINRSALEGAALQLDDLRGRPFWEARWWTVSPETVELTRERVLRAGQGEFVRCDVEVFGRAAGEETIVIDFSVLPVRDREGRIVFLLAEGRNITEKKRAEAEIARKNEELQTLLAKLQQADRLKSDFFANISHELRTPLALILGPTEALLSGTDPLTEAQRRHLDIIQRSAASLLGHVNDLLDLAKADAGRMVLSYARVDLAQVVRRAAEPFHALVPQTRVQYAITVPERLEAEVDPAKIERVLLNLLSNAFKFTPAGGRIRCHLEAGSGDSWVLSVQDSGPGVPVAMRRAIFERFCQANEGDGPHGGTGLGLAISKELVDLHGGTIVVTQAVGGGALFQVETPMHAPTGTYVRAGDADTANDGPLQASGGNDGPKARIVEADPAASLRTSVGAAAGTGAGEEVTQTRAGLPTVLVVEDNPDMRHFISDVLSTDHRVLVAEDGLQALALARTSAPDLVVTDLMLPGLQGDELVARMRAEPGLALTPVLVLSARGDDTLRTRLLAESVQDYVTKPFSAHELRARVRNLVMMKRARDVLQRELVSQSEDLTELTRDLIANQHALQRSMEALVESEHRWRALFEYSPVGIALVDPQGQIRATNAAFQHMLGYSREEIRHASLLKITPEEDQATMQARIARLEAGEVPEYHLQRSYRRKDGEVVWANTSVAVVPATHHAPRMLVVVAEDVTEGKRAAEDLAKAQNELARVARASTLGELAASIAHEVNQPLAAIAANGQACLRWLNAQPPHREEAEATVQRIVRDAHRASDVIARIRGFLRRHEFTPTRLNLGAVLSEVVELVQGEAQTQRVEIHHTPGRDLPEVTADRVQMQQVILNLVMNALEAMSTVGAPRRLEVGTSLTPAGDAVQVNVCDTGAGIAAADRDRIFEAFHTTKTEGMGMGLAISRSIIEAHGGRLWATPNADRGETFHFTIPTEHP